MLRAHFRCCTARSFRSCMHSSRHRSASSDAAAVRSAASAAAAVWLLSSSCVHFYSRSSLFPICPFQCCQRLTTCPSIRLFLRAASQMRQAREAMSFSLACKASSLLRAVLSSACSAVSCRPTSAASSRAALACCCH